MHAHHGSRIFQMSLCILLSILQGRCKSELVGSQGLLLNRISIRGQLYAFHSTVHHNKGTDKAQGALRSTGP